MSLDTFLDRLALVVKYTPPVLVSLAIGGCVVGCNVAMWKDQHDRGALVLIWIFLGAAAAWCWADERLRR